MKVVHAMLITGRGFDSRRLADLIQECLQQVCKVNPDRKVETWQNNRPPHHFIHAFKKRHNLVYRATMELNHARAIVSREEIHLWFQDTAKALVNHPEYSDCFKDGRRILNVVRKYDNKPKMADSRDLPKMAIMDYHGLSWTIMDYHGLSWTILDHNLTY